MVGAREEEHRMVGAGRHDEERTGGWKGGEERGWSDEEKREGGTRGGGEEGNGKAVEESRTGVEERGGRGRKNFSVQKCTVSGRKICMSFKND